MSCTEVPRAECSTPGGVSESRVEGENHLLDLLVTLVLMQPRIQLAFSAANTHCQLMLSFSPIPRLRSTALSPLIAQPVSVLGIAPTHVQDRALGLVELHEVHTGPPL